MGHFCVRIFTCVAESARTAVNTLLTASTLTPSLRVKGKTLHSQEETMVHFLCTYLLTWVFTAAGSAPQDHRHRGRGERALQQPGQARDQRRGREAARRRVHVREHAQRLEVAARADAGSHHAHLHAAEL